MGSYCELKFDEIHILSAKSIVPDNLIALFQESDRTVREMPETDEDEAHKDILYQAPREVILSRLALLGCTESVVRDRFAEWRKDQIESWTHYYAEYDEDSDRETLKALGDFDFAVWRERVPSLLDKQWDLPEPVDEIDRRMRDDDDGWLHFDGYGSLVTLRALLDVSERQARKS